MNPYGCRSRLASGLVACLVIGALGLTGCVHLTDIHDRSLIFGLAIDAGPRHGMVTLGAQALHPVEGGNGGGDAGGAGGGSGNGSADWKTLVASGSTLSGALDELQAKTDRQIFLGQLGVILLGGSLARQGVLHDLDAMLRSPQVAESLPLAVIEGSAVSFLQAGTQQQVAWRVRNFVTKPRAGVAVIPNPFWHFMAQSLDLAQATYAPAFAPAPQEEGLRFVGTAVFLRGRLVDTLSIQQSVTLSWLIKREGFGGITLGSNGDEFHVAIKHVRARWDLHDPQAPLLRVAASGEVTASPGTSLADRPAGMRKVVAQQMSSQILGLLARLQEDQADVLGIGERLRERRQLPPGPWAPNFSRLRFQVAVRVQLVPGKIR